MRTLNIDEPLARIKADGTVRYYQQDALGSVIGLTTDTGQLATLYSYDPFGNTTTSGEASDNPFQYTGRENDNTGLYYYRARYYSPELQRFISEDPIGLEGGDINFYVYVKNQPIHLTDSLGLKGCGPGSGFWEWIIPDKYPLADFTECCDDHDDCYGCKGQVEGKSRFDCDFKFCKCLYKKGFFARLFPGGNLPSDTYCLMVLLFGESSFKKARGLK